MPDFYAAGEYDIAGFIVGVADREHVIDGSRIEPGDELLALPSVGLHTNGYSLARKLLLEVAGYDIQQHVDEIGMTVGAALLQPHVSYLKPLDPLLDSGRIKGLAHITGGGLTDNLPRVLPGGCAVEINKGSWPMLPIFEVMQRIGKVTEPEMYRTFNMGVGMVVAVSANDQSAVRSQLEAQGTSVYHIGHVVSGNREVSIR
jgi:phosphoribosylformylglycinamidine cyclo-ligase